MPGPSEIGQGSPRCGAKTRSGKPCKNAAMENGRCRMHGGSTRNVPKGEASPHYRHGIYCQSLSDEEREIWADLGVDSLEEEIRLQKIMVRRAARAVYVLEMYPASFQVGFEANERESGIKGGELVDTKKLRRADVRAILDRALGRLAQLMTRHAELKGSHPDDALAFARRIQGHLSDLEAATLGEAV